MKKIREVMKMNYFNLNIIHYLTETDDDKMDVKFHIELEIEVQETEKSGCIFDKNNKMKMKFLKLVN